MFIIDLTRDSKKENPGLLLGEFWTQHNPTIKYMCGNSRPDYCVPNHMWWDVTT